MKILLIKAPYKEVYGPIRMAAGNYFLLGLGYIASYLKKHGHQVYMLDPEAQGLTIEECLCRAKEIAPQIIGISATTPDFNNALKIARMAKEATNAFMLLGGIHGSSLSEFILTKNPGVFDAICIGEGEQTSLEICKYLNGEIKSLKDIDGICYAEAGQVIRTKQRRFITDLDSLPFPARDLISIDLYKPHAFNTRKGTTATLITSRGCPFRCTFCASKLTLGGDFRARSARNVVDEIKHLVGTYNVRHILIQDDTFTYDMGRAKEACNMIIEEKLKVEWFCFSQVTKVDKELLKLMRRAGCYSIGFGIESVDSQVLKSIRKPINMETCEFAIRESKKQGLKVQAYFIFGNKQDSKESIEKTIDFACRTSPTLAFFNKLVAYPGTEIFKEYFGTNYDKIDWQSFVPMGVTATIASGVLTKAQLQKYVLKANLRFYLRPKQLLEIMSKIRSFAELKAYIKGGLGLILQMLMWRRQMEAK